MQLTVPSRFQGAPGRGHGGYTAGLVAAVATGSVAVSFRAPIPLDVPMDLIDDGGVLRLVHGDILVVDAHPIASPIEPLPPVTTEEAAEGRARAEREGFGHALPTCFSCGTSDDSMRVHAGPLDGRSSYATPVVYPRWTARDGIVAHHFMWAPVDCAAGFRVAYDDHHRLALTGSLAVEVYRPASAGEPLVVVADAEPGWDGRKRYARSAMYTAAGELLAASESLWIAVS